LNALLTRIRVVVLIWLWFVKVNLPEHLVTNCRGILERYKGGDADSAEAVQAQLVPLPCLPRTLILRAPRLRCV
jgi:hypothetical protein